MHPQQGRSSHSGNVAPQSLCTSPPLDMDSQFGPRSRRASPGAGILGSRASVLVSTPCALAEYSSDAPLGADSAQKGKGPSSSGLSTHLYLDLMVVENDQKTNHFSGHSHPECLQPTSGDGDRRS